MQKITETVIADGPRYLIFWAISVNYSFVILRSQCSSGDEESLFSGVETLRFAQGITVRCVR
jgi:hypothetical protein